MEIIKINKDNFKEHLNVEKIVTALGFFDGVHMAHKKILELTVEQANEMGIMPGAITFTIKKTCLTPKKYQYAIFESIGIKKVFELDFEEIKGFDKTEFIDFLKDNKVEHIVCGFDLRFGAKASGKIEDLLSEFKVTVYDKQSHAGEKIGTTQIIAALEKGDVKTATEMLGRKYSIRGYVKHGNKLGRTIGFPTANLDHYNYVLPKNGVYKVDVKIDGIDKVYKGVANIGTKPTVKEDNLRNIEVFIGEGFSQNLYDNKITIYFNDFIRDEQKFSHVEQLKQQLIKDSEWCK